jgi:dTDP-4-dehydrorhamnose reductase
LSAFPARNLIVGAAGQVGTQIVADLTPARSLGASRAERPGFLTFDLSTLDEPEAANLLERSGADAVYCVGAMTNVEECESASGLAVRTNCSGPAALAFAAARRGIPFVYFSTEYVFDGQSGPYAEDAAANPINVYGQSKWMGELEVARAHPAALIVRTTVVYGPDPGGRNFLHALRRAWLARVEFRVPGDQISTPTYNRDLARVVIALVERGATGVFHVCGPELLSRVEFATAAARHLGWEGVRIAAVATRRLGQVAPRPLQGGLLTEKLRRLHPDLRMRPLDECCADWQAAGAFTEDL